MEKYVVSRELSERLQASRYSQTEFYWIPGPDDTWSIYHWYDSIEYKIARDVVGAIAAPLSDELLEQLPKYIPLPEKEFGSYHLRSAYGPHGYLAMYERLAGEELIRTVADKPADALAELYLWCVEQGYIKNVG